MSPVPAPAPVAPDIAPADLARVHYTGGIPAHASGGASTLFQWTAVLEGAEGDTFARSGGNTIVTILETGIYAVQFNPTVSVTVGVDLTAMVANVQQQRGLAGVIDTQIQLGAIGSHPTLGTIAFACPGWTYFAEAGDIVTGRITATTDDASTWTGGADLCLQRVA